MTTTLLVALAALVLITLAIVALTSKQRATRSTIRRRPPLTKHEQPMYFRLREAFPQHVVLAQVAFSSLLATRGHSTRNTIDHLVADFVLCEKSFEVVAVIELDDTSHRAKPTEDDARDRILTDAGYRVLRFKTVPTAAELVTAIVSARASHDVASREHQAHAHSE